MQVEHVEPIWGRDHVLRVTVTDGRTAVVKRRRAEGLPEPERIRSFSSEHACLKFLSGMSEAVAPKLLGTDLDTEVMVIEELPEGRSLADSLLLGDRAGVADDLVAYARALATMHSWSIGRTGELEALFLESGPDAPADSWWLRVSREHTTALRALGRDAGADEGELVGELERAIECLGGARFRGLVHGDPCPDNVRLVEGSCRIFDYEAAAIGSVALDTTFLVAPFPSCWCFGRLPPDLSATALDAYWATMHEHGLDQDAEWRLANAAALAGFVVSRAGVLDRFLDPSTEWGTTGGAVRFLSWTTAAIAAAEAADAFPGMRCVFEHVRDRAGEAAPDGSVPDYPALADGPVSVKTPEWWKPGY